VLSLIISKTNSDFSRKSQTSFIPMYSSLPLISSNWNFVTEVGSKTRQMPLPCSRESQTMHSFRYNIIMWQTDRQTDRKWYCAQSTHADAQ